MVVDWLRECYQSRWQLFRDDAAHTAGYYYFSPPGTPHYPGVHNLGSRRWLDGNNGLLQGLGEELTAKHSHRTGVFGDNPPAARVVGTTECIREGEQIANAADPADLWHGYPLECWIPVAPAQPPPAPQPRDFERASAWDRCAVARLWAHIIDYSYVDARALITLTLLDFFKTPVTIDIHEPENFFPGLVVIVGANFAIVVADGTRNYLQYAMQALRAANGPTNKGIFSTNPLWYDASNHIHRKMVAAGVTEDMPTFFVGHSYGAAACLCLAARIRKEKPNRIIRYLTYGCPKIGDQRLVDLIAKCQGASLRNDNDIVTAVPPDEDTLFPVLVLFPILATYSYENWQRPPTALTQDGDGKLIPGGDFEIDAVTMTDIASNVILGQPFSRAVGHPISEYIRRIELRCPDVQWPICQSVDDDIEETVGGAVGIDDVFLPLWKITIHVECALPAPPGDGDGDAAAWFDFDSPPSIGPTIHLIGTAGFPNGDCSIDYIGFSGGTHTVPQWPTPLGDTLEFRFNSVDPWYGVFDGVTLQLTDPLGIGQYYGGWVAVGGNCFIQMTLEQLSQGVSDMAFYPHRYTGGHHSAIVLTGAPLFANVPNGAFFEFGVWYQLPDANGDSWTNGFFLKAGNYNLSIFTYGTNNQGILDLYIDGVLAVAGIDMYANPATGTTIVTNAVTVVGDGYHVLKGIINGKNPLSVGFAAYLGRFWFTPAIDIPDHS